MVYRATKEQLVSKNKEQAGWNNNDAFSYDKKM